MKVSGSQEMAEDSGVIYRLCMSLCLGRMGIVDSGMGQNISL